MGMNRKQFQELAAMLREHRKVINDEFGFHTNSESQKGNEGLRAIERDAKLMEINRVQDSLIGICNRNNSKFDDKLFKEAANYAFDPD